MRHKLLLITICVGIGLIILSAGLLLVEQNIGSVSTLPATGGDKSYLDIDFSKPTPAPLHPAPMSNNVLKQTAWIPDWGMPKGLESFRANIQYFDSISPVWYYLGSDGAVQTEKAGLDELKQLTATNHVRLIPSITSFSADDLHYILSDQTKLDAHIAYLESEIRQNGYDGFDLDYESIYLNDQPAYLYLAKTLFDYLDQQGKKLTIAVMPVWTDADIATSLRQTRKVQDWTELGRYAHELRIMTYDLTGYTSTFPGPIAPLDWIEATLRYAKTKINMGKIMIGINMYGYDGWSNNPVVPQPYLGLTANGKEKKGQADAVTYSQILNSTNRRVSEQVMQGSLEKLMIYKLNNREYYVYYPDADTMMYRIALAKQYGVAGFAYWRMGDEDTRIYQEVANQ